MPKEIKNIMELIHAPMYGASNETKYVFEWFIWLNKGAIKM